MIANGTDSAWLVEIRVKDWIRVSGGQSRIVCFEEVLAHDEVAARYAAFDQFERRCKHEPNTRRNLAQRNLTPIDCCAPEAVCLK